MTSETLTALKKAIDHIFDAQACETALWHEREPEGLDDPQPMADAEVMIRLAMSEHLTNYRLWHVEDEARRKDVGPEVIAQCKRDIDGYNQKRNDLIEKVDACLVALVTPLVPEDAPQRYNTETIGSALDRLSIMSLKQFHMLEQTVRDDVDDAHKSACQQKVDVLQQQRDDLRQSIGELLDDYVSGAKRPKVYYQFKMYNDPALNPSLYGKGKA